MRNIRYLFCFMLILTIVSCSSEKQGLKELKRLCEKDAGLTVYETVEAKGYYDDYTKCHHCWQNLIRSPFEYLEFCDFESERHSLTYILQEHGCYRLSKVPRSSGQCHKEIEEQVAGLVVEPFAEFKKSQCIRSEKIINPESQYKYSVNTTDIWIDRSKGVLIRKGSLKVEENNSDQLIAKNISYSLTPGGSGTPQSKPNVGCDSVYVTGTKSPEYKGAADRVFINSVLIAK